MTSTRTALLRESPETDQESGRRFVCQDESEGYADSLVQLVFNKFRNGRGKPTIYEFGSGNGEPVARAILDTGFAGKVIGYEVNPVAAASAKLLIDDWDLAARYVVHPEPFPVLYLPDADYLIANPPYIPCAPKDRHKLILPDLCGGKNGNDITKLLLSFGCPNVFLEVSSYADPQAVLQYANDNGYRVTRFQIHPLQIGEYSRQDIVWQRIQEMRGAGKAFMSKNCYLVGSAFFTKDTTNVEPDLSAEFLASLTALGRTEPVLAA